jgi:hypothetical protein
MRRDRWKVLATLAFLASGCSLITSLDGLTGGADGGPTEDAAIDAGDAGAIDSGSDSAGSPLTPRTWHLSTAQGPPPRHSARMVYDEARKVSVLFGGQGPNADDNETWQWDGEAWTQASINNNAPGGHAPGMAYDSADRVTLLFMGGSTLMWQFDGGTDWQTPGPVGSPPGLATYNPVAMAYDSARHVAVIFGGWLADGGLTNQMSEWSSTAGFVTPNPSAIPGPRLGHILVYDSARARTVMFGGYKDDNGDIVGDMWEYDGTTWTEITAAEPPARTAACAAYDPYRQVTVMFGGRQGDNTTALSDTWEWDGTVWRHGPTGPPGRRTCAMAYDAARNEIVMYGGSPGRNNDSGTSYSLGDTWIYQ